jgi:hypothetical protein
MRFTATDPQQLDTITELLQRALHLAPDHPTLDRSYLNWKYYEAGPSWDGSRSYVLAENGRILTHAAIWPVQLRLSDGIRSGIGFGDWAASEEQPGIGLLLLKKLLALDSFVLVTGGAEITRQILPRMGFQHWADRSVYARVLRPFRQLSTRTSHVGWREPLRLARNLAWSLPPSASIDAWTAQAAVPDDQILSLAQEQSGSLYKAEFVHFILRCPTAAFQYLILCKGGVPQGYAILGVVGRQGRIADLRIASEEQKDWNAVVGVVLKEFAKNESVCEVMAIGSVPALDKALCANGFRLRDRRPLIVFDSQGRLWQESIPHLGMLEDDSSFLYYADSPYLT